MAEPTRPIDVTAAEERVTKLQDRLEQLEDLTAGQWENITGRLAYIADRHQPPLRHVIQAAYLSWCLSYPQRIPGGDQLAEETRFDCRCHGSGMIVRTSTDTSPVPGDRRHEGVPCQRCNPVAFARFAAKHSRRGNHLHCRPGCPACERIVEHAEKTAAV